MKLYLFRYGWKYYIVFSNLKRWSNWVCQIYFSTLHNVKSRLFIALKHAGVINRKITALELPCIEVNMSAVRIVPSFFEELTQLRNEGCCHEGIKIVSLVHIQGNCCYFCLNKMPRRKILWWQWRSLKTMIL